MSNGPAELAPSASEGSRATGVRTSRWRSGLVHATRRSERDGVLGHNGAQVAGSAKVLRAFSLVELTMVVAILAILSAMAVPRVSNMLRRGRLDLASRRLMADLQLVRSQAIRDSADRKLVLDLALHRYAMPQYNGTTTTSTIQLNGSPYEGVRLTGTSYNPTEVTFNRLGIPQAGGTITLRAGADQITITISSTTGRATRAWGP